MSESAPEQAIESTGVATVDEALGSLATLDGLPVADQVAVFERAHAALGAALDGVAPAE